MANFGTKLLLGSLISFSFLGAANSQATELNFKVWEKAPIGWTEGEISYKGSDLSESECYLPKNKTVMANDLIDSHLKRFEGTYVVLHRDNPLAQTALNSKNYDSMEEFGFRMISDPQTQGEYILVELIKKNGVPPLQLSWMEPVIDSKAGKLGKIDELDDEIISNDIAMSISSPLVFSDLEFSGNYLVPRSSGGYSKCVASSYISGKVKVIFWRGQERVEKDTPLFALGNVLF